MDIAFGGGGAPGTWWVEPWLDGMVVVAACPAGHRVDVCRRSSEFPLGHPDDRYTVGPGGVLGAVECGGLGCSGIPAGSKLVGFHLFTG
jgi:hypothetical protein